MSGVLAVRDSPAALDAIEHAAAPLLRRPWQRLRVAPNVRPGAAIAFAGERGGVAADPAAGVAVALDGSFYGEHGPRSGDGAAGELLALYLAEGPGLDPPEGRFAAVVLDGRSGELVLVSDRYGHRPVYRGRTGGTLVVAGELKALLALGVPTRLDLQSAAELLAYEHILDRERTLLETVATLPGGSTLVIDAEGRERLTTRWRYRLEPTGSASADELAAEFAELLTAAVGRRLGPHTGLALSGGIDSRCLAAVLASSAPETPTASYGAAHSVDLVLAGEVAARAGLPHRSLPFPAGYIDRGAAETVWLSEGQIRCFHAHHLALRPLRSLGLDSVLIGYGGDHVLRWTGPLRTGDGGLSPERLHAWRSACLPDALARRILTPAFAAAVEGRAAAALGDRLRDRDGDPLARTREIFFETQNRKIWPGAELFADDLEPHDPYHDHALVDFCRRMPEPIRRAASLQRAFVRLSNDALARVPTTKEGVPPALEGWRREIAVRRHRARVAARARADRLLGPGWWPKRGGIGDYATDLRHAPGVLRILLEPRTLERGQVRKDEVRRLIEETLAGRASHTRTLGTLLTFEIFQRQFVDGDGFHAESEAESEPAASRR